MWRLSLLALSSLLLLGAAGHEFEGLGEVPVVGGNLVSARRLALRNARRDAVARAVATLVPEQQLAAHESRLRQAIYLRATRYVRTYRVLEEARQGATFRLRLAAALDLKRLQGDLTRLLGAGYTTPGPQRSATLGLALRLPRDAALAAELRQRLRQALGRAGISSVDLGQGHGRTPPALALVLRGELSCQQAPGVRGASLEGASCRAALRLERVAGGETLASGEAQAWGAGATEAEARQSAARQALDRALAPLLARLRSLPDVAAHTTLAGGKIVRLSGVLTHAQYDAVSRALQRSIPGVGSCRVRRVARGEVWYQLTTRAQPRALASALEQHSFGSFSLKLKSISGESIWMTVEPTPQG
jgi:hypothetical protein